MSLNETYSTKSKFSSPIAYGILILAVCAVAFFGVCSPQQLQDRGITGNAASVAGKEISRDEFSRAYEYRLRMMSQANIDPGQMRLAENILNSLTEKKALVLLARQGGVGTSVDEATDTFVNQIKNSGDKFDVTNFKDRLRQNGYTEKSFIEELSQDITLNKYRRLYSDGVYISRKFVQDRKNLEDTKINLQFLKFDPSNVKVSVTAEEVSKFLNDAGKDKVKSYYEQNLSKYQTPKKVRASHILISYGGARRAPTELSARTKDQAKEMAAKILAEVKAPNANFAALASKYTDEQSGKTKGGDLGFFAAEDMVKEFSETAFKMKPNEISDLVESPFGFHIIQVQAIQEATSRSLEQETDGIAKKLIEDERKPQVLEKRIASVLEELKTGKPATTLLRDYGIQWQDTGEFSGTVSSVPSLGSDASLLKGSLALSKPGQLLETPIEMGGSKFIVRLKERKSPSSEPTKESEIRNLQRQAAYSFGGSLYAAVSKEFTEKLKKENKIWLNPTYLSLDQQAQKTEK